MKPLYTAIATAHGGRDGTVESSEGTLALKLAMPKELGGPGGPGTNPEQLFAAGYAACFESALRFVARLQKLPLTDARIRAEVTIGRTDDGGFGLKVALHGRLEGMGEAEALSLMNAAHQVCPYSRATRGNIDVSLALET
jgi:Ohr subfamily peroxiredoxin